MKSSTLMLFISTFFTLIFSISTNSATQQSVEETHNLVKAGNKYVTLLGTQVNVGDKAPNFKVVNESFSKITLDNFDKKIILISVVPSIDTGVCSLQTKRFNEEVTNLPGSIVMLTISNDLPFAQKRFCKAESISKIKLLSDAVWRDFGSKYGLLIKDMGLLTRSIFIIDEQGKIVYKELVENLSKHPDYEMALATLKAITPLNSILAAEKIASELEIKGGGWGRPGTFYEPGKKEPYTGKMLRHWPNGNKQAEAHIISGKLDGVVIEWHKNGQMYKKGTYKANIKEDLHTKWNEDGQLTYSATYKNGEKHGEITSWFDNGRKFYNSYWRNGKKHGLDTGWHDNGVMAHQSNYENGNIVGVTKSWFENGRIKEQVNYVNGEKRGTWTQWYDNGQKWSEKYFIEKGKDHGKEHGSAKVWNKDGSLKAHLKWDKGEYLGNYKVP